MSTSTRRRVAFVVSLSTVVAMSGFLLNAAPPQAVGTWEVRGTTNPSSARTGAATATLANGSTLIAGGRLGDGSVTDSVVVYDPMTNESTVVGYLVSPRVNAAAARLDDGRVLVAGGEVGELLSADVEIFDPTTGTSSAAPSLTAPRTRHAAARLADGKVLIVGGVTVDGVVLATTELFDPATGNMLAAGSMATPRSGASATLLIDNRVLVAGGNDGTQDLASAELFYPETQEFFPVDTALSQARAGHTAVLLPHNGAVLIAGGTVAGAPVNTTDLFLPTMFPDPYTWSMGTFGPAEHLTHARTQAVSGPMGDDGYAFVAGGGAAKGEAYAFVTLKTDKDDYAPGQAALITGSGWQPDEEVTLVFQEDPAVHPDYVLTLTADGEGNISHDTWAPEAHDFGVRFYLTATGVASQRRAQVTFTDAGVLTVQFAGTGTGLIASTTGVPNSCTGTCLITIGNNGNFDVTATPAVGSSFGGWLGCDSTSSSGSLTDNVCRARLQGASVTRTITVTFNTSAVATTTSIDAPSITYGQSGSVTVSVDSSSATGSVSLTVDGSSSASGTLVGGSFTFTSAQISALGTLTLGNHSLSASYAGGSGFSASSATGTLTVNQAASVTVVTCPTNVIYTGLALTPCTVSVTGDGGLNLIPTPTYANNTNAGTATASYSYAGDANHTSSSNSKNFSIDHALSVTTVTCPANVTYDGSAQTPCSANVTGAGGLSQALTVNYTDNTNAGTASASASYAGGTNHLESTGAATFTIDQAPSVTTVTCPANVTYDGSAQTPCSANVTGAGGLNQALTVSYSNNTNAGTASASASYAGDANHTSDSDSETFIINQAPSTTTVSCPANVTYNGLPQTPCTAAATGVGGLNEALTVNYTNNTNAGTATASASFAGDANHTSRLDSETFTIDQAPSVTTVTCPANVTYDGSAQTPCSANVTGAGGLNQALTVSYSNNTNAGTASASASYAGDANHTSDSDSETFIINQAPSTTTVSCPANVTYNGLPQTPCTAAATGVGGLNEALTVNYTNNTNAGTASASASYAGDANHTSDSDSETFIINQAPSTTTVTIVGGPFVYNGAPHTPATVLVTGAGGLNLTPTATYANNVNAGTATASYSFAGDANHTDSNDTENFAIGQRLATWTTNSASKTLGALDPVPLTTGFGDFLAADGVSATYSRAAGETVAVAGNPYHITATLSATGLLTNYAITNAGASFTIGYATTGMCFGSLGHQVLQPLNTDGSSVVKKGSTVPVKFRVCDVNGNSVGTPGVVASFQLVQVINGLATTLNEDPVSTTPDSEFRWSATDKQWIFNLNTKNLTNGKTYVYKITLNDGSSIDFQFGTKQ